MTLHYPAHPNWTAEALARALSVFAQESAGEAALTRSSSPR
jgi:hypothetical protein